MSDNATKKQIIDRLFKSVGICAFCKRQGCGHEGNRELPTSIGVNHVLEAINLDEWFFKEPK